MESQLPVRVSLFEHQRLFRERLVDLLDAAGFNVVGNYADPRQFLANVPTDRPAVAVADLAMRASAPNDDGSLLLSEVHRHHPSLRLLVLSDEGNPNSEFCYREGAAGYVDAANSSSLEVVAAVAAVARGERLFPIELRAPEPAREPSSPLLGTLSIRERQVLACVAAGADNLKISALLQISERTVKAHMSKLYQKLGSENRTQLALLALQLGLRPSSEV